MNELGECFDVVVIGGGPVGLAAALEMQAAGFNLLLLESRETAPRPTDLRPLALSYGSRLILERLGLWHALAAATPIERIHVSHRGGFGRTLLTASEAALPALGYVVDYRGLMTVMDAARKRAGVRVLDGARVESISHDRHSARVEYETAEGIHDCLASIVIVADGSAAAGTFEVQFIDYGQSAVTARIATDRPHANTAYERFTAEGPLALLPYESGYAVVWTTSTERAQRLCAATTDSFLAELHETFGERAGRFSSVGERAAHRVNLRVAERSTAGRAVLVGNAAQALHPVAGQGLNLGLRDAWELACEMRQRGVQDAGVIEAYRARRRVDRAAVVAFTHSIVKIFSNDSAPLAAARGAGLVLLDCLPPAKDFIVRRMVFGARG